MADALPRPRAGSAARRISRLSFAHGAAAALLFGAGTGMILSSGFAVGSIVALWHTPMAELPAAGGQWLAALLVVVLRQIPGAGPWLLVGLTASVAAGLIVWFSRILLRRGWGAVEASALVAALMLNPVVLYLATTGQPRLLSAAVVAAVVLCCDRLEAIADVQSQMALGLILAILMVTDPNGVYVLMFLLVLLPVLYRDIVDLRSALAAYTVVALPPLIALGAVAALVLLLSQQPLDRLLAQWSAPLHGASAQVATAEWALHFGGRFLVSGAAIAGLALLVFPPILAPLFRLARDRRERSRPGTALVAFGMPIVAGAVATGFWHTIGAWIYLSYALVGGAIWIATSSLSRAWRRGLVAAALLGLVLSWSLPQPWFETEKQQWRRSLLGVEAPAAR